MVVRQLHDLEALSADKASQELHLQQAVQAESLKAMKNIIDTVMIKTCLQRELNPYQPASSLVVLVRGHGGRQGDGVRPRGERGRAQDAAGNAHRTRGRPFGREQGHPGGGHRGAEEPWAGYKTKYRCGAGSLDMNSAAVPLLAS